MSIDYRYIFTFSHELRKKDWVIKQHDYCFTADNMLEDISVLIPKQIDEFNPIHVWIGSTIMVEVGTVTALDNYLKGLLV